MTEQPTPHAFEFPVILTRDPRRAVPVLTVIVPVCNEVGTLHEIFARIADVSYTKQVIVVDDGSKDEPDKVFDAWMENPEFEFVRHNVRLGKGAAIRTALQFARGKFIIIQDADLEYDPEDFPLLIEPLLAGQTQVVYGSRYLDRSCGFSKRFWRFRFDVAGMNLAARLVHGARLTDVTTGYKAFSTELLRKLDLQCARFDFCIEVTGKLCRWGETILEVPIHYQARYDSAGSKRRRIDNLRGLATLWRWRRSAMPNADLAKIEAAELAARKAAEAAALLEQAKGKLDAAVQKVNPRVAAIERDAARWADEDENAQQPSLFDNATPPNPAPDDAPLEEELIVEADRIPVERYQVAREREIASEINEENLQLKGEKNWRGKNNSANAGDASARQTSFFGFGTRRKARPKGGQPEEQIPKADKTSAERFQDARDREIANEIDEENLKLKGWSRWRGNGYGANTYSASAARGKLRPAWDLMDKLLAIVIVNLAIILVLFAIPSLPSWQTIYSSWLWFRYAVLPHWTEIAWFRWGIVAFMASLVALLLSIRTIRGR